VVSTISFTVPLWQQPVFWVTVAVVLFVLLFGRKIWSALAAMLDARAAKIRVDLDEAARLKQEAQVMLREALAQREQALADATTLLESARAEAARVAEAAAADAETAARRRERMAIDRIAAAEKAATDEVRFAAAEIAARAAEQMLARDLTAGADAPLIDRAIAQLPTALAGRRAA